MSLSTEDASDNILLPQSDLSAIAKPSKCTSTHNHTLWLTADFINQAQQRAQATVSEGLLHWPASCS
jgi:hypothetical protein